MIIIPPKDDTKVFNMKTFRDPLSNIIEITHRSSIDLKEISRQKEAVVSMSTLIDELDNVKIWKPSSNHRKL